VGDGRFNLCEVADCHGSVDAQTVRFDEDAGFLQPREEVIFVTLKLNVTKAPVAEHVTADTNVCLLLCIDSRGQYLEKLLKFSFASQ